MRSQEYQTLRQVEDGYWWYGILRHLTTAAVSRHVSPTMPALVLDAGCGTGGTLEALRRTSSHWQLHGFDISPQAVEHTQQRGFTEVWCGNVSAIAAADATFDAVTSLDVLSHSGVDILPSFSELLRVLKPGGHLILNLPAFKALTGRHDQAVCTGRRFTASEVRHLHVMYGLELRSIHYWNAWLFAPILIWRMLTRALTTSANAAAVRSDLSPLPAQLNRLLLKVGLVDAAVCTRFRLPFGTSIFSVARKPVSP